MRSARPYLFLIIGLLAALLSSAQEPALLPEPGFDLSAELPIEDAVLKGRLDNGLTYFIRTNQKPENRAELWLVVNAGSVQEDDNQRGLAHFVEHMAFNGTRNFEKQELVNYLESIGMTFGPDINAFTSFDETVYNLTIPTDDDETVSTAFQILEDWAHGLAFEGEEIDKERGVVVEEWRLGRGAEARIRDKHLPVLFKGSRYAERLPIGERDILESAPHEALRRFYRDW
ncbi:MAG: insulinase family protein [Thermoanaerobaculia bacterium]